MMGGLKLDYGGLRGRQDEAPAPTLRASPVSCCLHIVFGLWALEPWRAAWRRIGVKPLTWRWNFRRQATVRLAGRR